MFTVGRSLGDDEFGELTGRLAARVDSGDYKAARELADIALRELREVDITDRLGGLFARAEAGDRDAMALAARLRREGRIVPHDIPFAVDVYARLVKTDPKFNEALVDALLCSDDPADWKRAFDICSDDGGDWTWDYLARMHHEGVGTPGDIYEAMRIIERHDLFLDRIRCALRIRPELHGRRCLVLAGTPDEVDLLLLRCMQDNVKPDFWWCPEGGLPRYTSLLDEVVSKTTDPYSVPGAVLLCETPVDAPGLPMYSVTGGESLLVPDKGLEPATTCFVYTDEYLDSESERFLRSAAVFNANNGTGPFESLIDSGGSEMSVVVAADIETSKSVLSKIPMGRARICTGHYSRSLEYILPIPKMLHKSLARICFEYALGKQVYNKICVHADKNVLISGYTRMGDQFRPLSRRESYSVEEPQIIVGPRARDLPELAGLDGYLLSKEQYSSIGTYTSLTQKFSGKVSFVIQHTLFPALDNGFKACSFILSKGLSRRYAHLGWSSSEVNETGASSIFYARFPVAERSPEIPPRSVLINPYANYMSRFSEFVESSRRLFDEISRDLTSRGYTVYTNAPSDEQTLLPGSRRLDISMGELVPIIESFDFVITTFTGFMEAVMPTGVNLAVVCPKSDTRRWMAFECRRSNYWEYKISAETDDLAEEICDLVTSTPPAHSSPSENVTRTSRIKHLDFSEDLISATDTVIWDTEAVDLAYREVRNDPSFTDACASHPESPFVAYYEGMKLVERRCWQDSVELLRRSYIKGCRNASAPLYRALWALGTQEAHETLLSLIIDLDDPLANGYRGLLLARGAGIERNPNEAAGLLRSAMKGGVKFAANELFDVLWMIGTPEAYKEMIDVASSLAEKGDGNAMGRLGRAYRDGRGVEQNIDKAAEWMRKSVEKNIGWARIELFDVLWKMGTPEAYTEMVSIITPLAEKGDGNAMGRLGRAYRDGRGVEQNIDKAAEWMRKSVEKNIGWARIELFDVLWVIGTPEAYTEAVTIVQPLAEKGDRNALKRLSKAYAEGLGVPADPDMAIKLMTLTTRK